jgi:hypothetical protein
MPEGAKKLAEHAVTVPAPASSSSPESTTTIPDYDVQALATASSLDALLPRPQRQLPLDLAVPIRLSAPVVGASLRASFLLTHVDDRMTIAEIAMTAQIPISDAIENFLALAELGAIELRGAGGHPSGPPESTENEKALLDSTVRKKI